MERQTDIAQTIDIAADKAKYDECAKKLLTYESVIAWILKSCTKEFSQYSVKFIADNCIKEKPEISQKSVHQDQPDKTLLLDGDKKIDCLNTEANSIFESEVRDMCNLSNALVNQGIQQGVQQGEDLLAQLIQKLFALGRTEDVKRVAEDKEYRHMLMTELSISR